jgi:hypothetical protein
MLYPQVDYPSNLPLNVPRRFQPHVDTKLIADTQSKLALARYPEEQDGFDLDDWSQGAKVERVRELATYWQNEYDWATQEVCFSTQSFGERALNNLNRKRSRRISTTTLYSSTFQAMEILYFILSIRRAVLRKAYPYSFVTVGQDLFSSPDTF